MNIMAILSVLVSAIVLWLAVVRWMLFRTKKQLRDESRNCNLLQTEIVYLRQLLVNELLQSIKDTDKLLKNRSDKSTIKVKTYSRLLTDKCRRLFTEQFNNLHSMYAVLESKDIVLIILLGLGIENQTIANIFDCSLRTIYKHRQFIAHAMQISSLELDAKAQQFMTNAIGNTIGMPK